MQKRRTGWVVFIALLVVVVAVVTVHFTSRPHLSKVAQTIQAEMQQGHLARASYRGQALAATHLPSLQKLLAAVQLQPPVGTGESAGGLTNDSVVVTYQGHAPFDVTNVGGITFEVFESALTTVHRIPIATFNNNQLAIWWSEHLSASSSASAT
ncbi:MAG: hypothetical protein OWQ59_01480 [Alicyclobacillaceae bacterium]|nr:hypothetical protein [Alicyclobacillaceae bacterium]